MDPFFIYNLSVSNSEEFYSLDQYYQFLIKGQEVNWENWLESRKNLPRKQLLKLQKEISSYFRGEKNLELFRPCVSTAGLVIGSPICFLTHYYLGDKDFYDIVT